MGQTADGVHACRGNQEQFEPACHSNVLGVGGIGAFPRVTKHRSAGKGLKGRFSDESLRVRCHQHIHHSAALGQLADHMTHFVCGNTPGDPDTDMPSLKRASV